MSLLVYPSIRWHTASTSFKFLTSKITLCWPDNTSFVFVSFGVIGSSVNMAYAEALPYLSMLKIIGIKDRKIAFFSYIDAIVLTLLGFVLAALNAYVINLLLRAFVDMGALLEDVGVEITGINLFAVLFCFVLCAGFGMAFYLFNYAKIRKMNINNVFLHELGEGV